MRHTLIAVARRWPILAAATLLGIGLAALAVTFQTPQYTGTAEVLVQQTGETGPTSPGARVVASYAAALEGRDLADEAGVDGSVTATVAGGSDVVALAVRADSADEARAQAAALTDTFVAWVAEQAGGSGLTATVVSSAAADGSPTSPVWAWYLLSGAAAGLLLGILVALARSGAPAVVGTADDAKSLTDAPVLGTVAQDPDMSQHPLLSQLESNHPRRESMRILRTNLQFLDVDAPQQVITITSALPGEGKSTTSASLAIALAETGRRVLLIDGDLRKPRLDTLFGLERTVGLTTTLVGRVSAESAIQSTRTAGLDVLTTGTLPPNPSELLQTDAMLNLVGQLSQSYDLVLIDGPPLLAVTDGALLAALSDGALVVVRHGRTRLDELKGAAERLHAVGARVLGTVITMTPRRSTSRYGYGSGYGPEFFARETARPTRRGGSRRR
ncbi:MAG: polysaccharide biosynthesis tyrosine autokinase [Aeromicrobium sp.]|uniref:polysaccharide biosynthesis tyrosine autokinase n=1 Tax=Aeromicrobium sp. TaxID=1871063 RepID=UPI00262775D2|nr:polysaccharide biosynthesis tyrosine autokinase [Aeromicrobium sp.]MDF1704450.1 polysaccharide biosynthesis tyrosine autokinase [Aeromicrobium sp.]